MAATRVILEIWNNLDAPLDLRWTWNYASEVAELRSLYERGKKGQWNAEEDVDWSTPFPHDQWFLPRQNVLILPTILTLMGADEDTCRDAQNQLATLLDP